jgi:hypothetical protein
MSRNSVRAAHRRRRVRGGLPAYDGVTDEQVYEQDGWQCRMPVCLHPGSRQLYPGLAVDDPWRASIDHVIPLSEGGPDTADNKRAAHQHCNMSADYKPRGLRQRLADVPGAEKLAGMFGDKAAPAPEDEAVPLDSAHCPAAG